jgi:hypothetical protein
LLYAAEDPSTSPTQAPSPSPSTNPTSSPTSRPSSPPTSTPSVAPSSTPTTSPSSAPSEPTCESTQGVWGGDSGESTVIAYGYELETAMTGLTIIGIEDYIETEVLPELERAIVDSVLSEVFPENCGSGRRKLRVGRRLEVIGVSKNPPDEIVIGGE